MKKRVWGILLTLTLCAAALCVSAGAANLDGGYVDEGDDSCDKTDCIAHATVPGGTPGRIWRWHLTSLDEIAYHLSGAGEWNSKYKTIDVKFLSDVTTDKPFCIDQCFTCVTLDLNGHTISGELSDSPVAEVNYGYGTQRVIIQNGTIKNTAENGIALQLTNGAVTLENVNVTGDLVLSYNFASSINYIPTFLGGGTFTKIRGAENDPPGRWFRRLYEMLGEGCYMLDGTGKRLDANTSFGTSDNSDIKILEKVQCKACDHKDADGKYTLFVEALTENDAPAMRCTVCNNLCPHNEIDADLKCTVCKLPILIEATNLLNKEDIGPWYYTGFDDAMQEILHIHKGRRPTLELLADTESACRVEWLTNDYEGITIDLAGHTLKLTGDNKTRFWLTFLNSSKTKPGKVVGAVNVSNTSSDRLKLVILNTDNNLTIETVNIGENATAELAGGSFDKITVPTGKPLASLLVSGYYFADSTSGKPAALYDANGNALTMIENVTVKPCSHDGSIAVLVPGTTAYPEYQCPCGQVTFAASVTKNETTTYYDTLQQAVDAAGDGGTVKVLSEFLDADVTVSKDVTLDLTGQKLWYNGNTTLKAPRLIITGNVTLLAGESGTLTVPVDVKSGGTLTVPKELGDGKNNLAFFSGAITVDSGSKAELRGGTFDLVEVNGGEITVDGGGIQRALLLQENSTAVISGRTVSSLTLVGQNDVTISGGSFGSITIYETYGGASVWPHEVTYADFAGLLTGGKAFQLTGGTSWANSSNLVPYSNNYVKYMTLSGVTVADAPITSVTISGADSAEYGATTALTASATTTAAAGENPTLTYQWYSVDAAGERTAIENAADESYPLPVQDVGSYTYAVTVNCGGYVCESEPFTVIVTPRVLRLPMIQTGTDTKVYDGTAASNIRLSGFYAGIRYGEEPVDLTKDTDFTLENAVYTGVNAGNPGIRFTATLLNPNYTFENPYMDALVDGWITKAVAPAAQEGALTVANNQAATYSFDFKSLLPAPEAPKTYGTITYELGAVNLGSYYTDGAAITDGVLTLPILAVSTNVENTVGTVAVTVSTTNYEDIILTLNVSAVNKKLPVLDGNVVLSRTSITYGDKLSTVSLSGAMKCDGQVVAGTFAWQEPDAKLNAGSHTAGWVFTPNDLAVYLSVTGTASITVNKATPSGAPKYTPITTAGKTLADANLTANESWPAGSIEWMYQGTDHTMDPATEVKVNTAYEWLFTPYDTINYESLRGSLTPYSFSSGGGGGGGSTATNTETTTNPDGSTTKTETKSDGTVIETTTGKDGSVSKTETKPDGSSVTESRDANGTTGTVKTDKDGKTEAEAKISNKAVEDAKKSGEAVKVPTEVKAGEDSNSAPTVKVELPKNAGETKIEIPVSDVNSGTVAIIVHPDGTEEIVKDSVPTKDGVQLTVDGSATIKIIDNSKDFIDTRDHWSRDEVNFVASREIFNGVGGNSFGVDQPMTRGMVNTVLARLAGIDTTPKSGQKWYEVGTAWAKENGITDGTNPEASVTREQLATLLYRFSGTPEVNGSLLFNDAHEVSEYAENALIWATQNGILNGIGSERIAPNANAQRAQVAAMLARYLKNL